MGQRLIMKMPIPAEFKSQRLDSGSYEVAMRNIGGETRVETESRFPGLLSDFEAGLITDRSTFLLCWTYIGMNPQNDISAINAFAVDRWNYHCSAALAEFGRLF